MASLLAVLLGAVGATVAGVHAVAEPDAFSERFNRWVAALVSAAAVLWSL